MQITLKHGEEITISAYGGSYKETLINSHGTLFFIDESTKKCKSTPDFQGFLHRHPKQEEESGIDATHVIVDKKDWEIVRNKNCCAK